MAENVKDLFKGALCIDFTGRLSSFQQCAEFDDEVVGLIRSNSSIRALIVVDRSFAGRTVSPLLVRDHINLTGDNPLVGPNHPAGERFPVVQGVYVCDYPGSISSGVVGGLKHGTVPSFEEISLLRTFGVDFCSYNVVPTMLVAAHAGWKVLAIALPDNAELSNQQVDELNTLVRGG